MSGGGVMYGLSLAVVVGQAGIQYSYFSKAALTNTIQNFIQIFMLMVHCGLLMMHCGMLFTI